MRAVALDDVQNDLLRHLQNHESVLIIRGGKPAGVLFGFASEDDCYDYLLRNDPELLQALTAHLPEQDASPGA
jgi:hypothetical protein